MVAHGLFGEKRADERASDRSAFHVVAFATREAAEFGFEEFIGLGLPLGHISLFVPDDDVQTAGKRTAVDRCLIDFVGITGDLTIPGTAACAAERHLAAGRAVVMISESLASDGIGRTARQLPGLVATISSFDAPGDAVDLIPSSERPDSA